MDGWTLLHLYWQGGTHCAMLAQDRVHETCKFPPELQMISSATLLAVPGLLHCDGLFLLNERNHV